jgi:signal transduction histidine kinase
MEETIQGLLDFARPPQLHRVQHDLRETVRRALNLVEGRAIHEGVAVVSRLSPIPLIIDADPEQIHQVFVNLLINGIESMQPSGTLDVTAAVSECDPRRCQVIFADRGGGIPMERLSRIFDPFVTTKERGTGLGLAISRRIVREHGGSIIASNRPEGGAAFTVELPLVRPLPSLESHQNATTFSSREKTDAATAPGLPREVKLVQITRD